MVRQPDDVEVAQLARERVPFGTNKATSPRQLRFCPVTAGARHNRQPFGFR